MLSPMSRDVVASMDPYFRDNMMAMSLAKRPPVVFDNSRESSNLIKCMVGKDNCIFLSIMDDGVVDKVRGRQAGACRGEGRQ